MACCHSCISNPQQTSWTAVKGVCLIFCKAEAVDVRSAWIADIKSNKSEVRNCAPSEDQHGARGRSSSDSKHCSLIFVEAPAAATACADYSLSAW